MSYQCKGQHVSYLGSLTIQGTVKKFVGNFNNLQTIWCNLIKLTDTIPWYFWNKSMKKYFYKCYWMVYIYKVVCTGVATSGGIQYMTPWFIMYRIWFPCLKEKHCFKPMKPHVCFNNYSHSVIMHFHDNCFSSNKTIRVQRWCRTFFLVKNHDDNRSYFTGIYLKFL